MVWFYLSLIINSEPLAVVSLSIPLWSDFIRIKDITYCKPDKIFQSHYGLILSQLLSPDSNFCAVLSIPLWSDFITGAYWRVSSSSISFNPTMVWFYLLTLFTLFLNFALLSIPLWSDFITKERRLRFELNIPFQSHYGLILSQCSSIHLSWSRRSFNPILVWFYQ